jgi:hypothetical protein
MLAAATAYRYNDTTLGRDEAAGTAAAASGAPGTAAGDADGAASGKQ